MTETMPQLDVVKKTGFERFHNGGSAADSDLLDFWRWSSSDLVSNVTRGVLAEYIVARAVGVSTAKVRDPWAAFDLETPDGIKIEVKSSGFVQSWRQSRPSSISFGTSKSRAWDPESGHYSPESILQADIYVFALLAHRVKSTIDPLDLDQWKFYVLSAAVLDGRKGSPSSITLHALAKLASPVTFDKLAADVRRVYAQI